MNKLLFEVTVKYNNGSEDKLKVNAVDRSQAIQKTWSMYRSKADFVYKVSASKFKTKAEVVSRRECLRCETKFVSQGFHNRVCDSCKETDIYKREVYLNAMSTYDTGRMISKKKGSP